MKQILNQDVIWSRYELGTDFFNEYLVYFEEHADKIYKALNTQFQAREFEEMARSAHDLKGLCFNLGLEAYAEHLIMIERLAYNEVVEVLPAHIEQLPGLTKQAIAALVDYRTAQEG